MAMWAIEGQDDYWDDGLTFKPGENGFTTSLVSKQAGKGAYNYVGTPNWEPPVTPESAQ